MRRQTQRLWQERRPWISDAPGESERTMKGYAGSQPPRGDGQSSSMSAPRISSRNASWLRLVESVHYDCCNILRIQEQRIVQRSTDWIQCEIEDCVEQRHQCTVCNYVLRRFVYVDFWRPESLGEVGEKYNDGPKDDGNAEEVYNLIKFLSTL